MSLFTRPVQVGPRGVFAVGFYLQVFRIDATAMWARLTVLARLSIMAGMIYLVAFWYRTFEGLV